MPVDVNINTILLTQNDCYKTRDPLTPKGIMVHSTGANNPRLSRYIQPDDGKIGVNSNNNDWNRSGVSKCVHAFIGKTKEGLVEIYQTLPWNIRGWHGGGSSNNTHIGFEICEDSLEDETYLNDCYLKAIELCAYLCVVYKLNPLKDGVIIGHYEGYQRGTASNHADPKHWFEKFGKTMAGFRNDVANKIKESEEEKVTQEQFNTMMNIWLQEQSKKPVDEWAKESFDLATEKQITDGTRPQSFATRQEVVQLIDNVIGL